MMDKENQNSEDFLPTKGNSDMILLIALLVFIVFVAVAAFIIVTDTKGLWYPGWGPDEIRPMLVRYLLRFQKSWPS
jgi:hypothetical protein